jgi:hypothetical protein
MIQNLKKTRSLLVNGTDSGYAAWRLSGFRISRKQIKKKVPLKKKMSTKYKPFAALKKF